MAVSWIINPFTGALDAIGTPAGGPPFVTGTGVAGRVTIWTGVSTIGSDAEFTYDSTTNVLTVPTVQGFGAGGELTLRANSGAWNINDEIQVFNPLSLNTGLISLNSAGQFRALSYTLTAGYDNANAVLNVLNFTGQLTINVAPAGDAVLFRNTLTQRLVNPLFNGVLGSAAVANQPIFVAATGVTNAVGGSTGFSHSPQYSVEGTGLFITGGDTLIAMTPIYNTGTSGMSYIGVELNTPGGTAGAAGCMEFTGINIDDFTPTDTTLDFCFKSLGAHKFLMGSGSQMRLGTNSTIFAAETLVDMVSTTHIFRIMRMTTAQRNAISVGTNGMMVFDTTLSDFAFANNALGWYQYQRLDADLTAIAALAGTGILAHTGAGTWAERTITSSTAALTVSNGNGVAGNPTLDLDADLTTLAGLTVAQGALIIGNATPAWSALGIGATDKYLRSNGTTAAWADVTELGLVDTYNGVTTAARGMPSVVLDFALTGQNGNVALNEFFNVATTGWYRVSGYTQITTAAGVSSTLPQINLVWIDGASGVGQSHVLTTTATTNTTGTSRQDQVLVYAQAGAFSLGYSTSGYASNAAGAMVYTVRFVVEAL